MSTTVRWMSMFVDSPPALFDTSAAFWTAVTHTRIGPAVGDHDEFLPLEPVHGDPCLWLQRTRERRADLSPGPLRRGRGRGGAARARPRCADRAGEGRAGRVHLARRPAVLPGPPPGAARPPGPGRTRRVAQRRRPGLPGHPARRPRPRVRLLGRAHRLGALRRPRGRVRAAAPSAGPAVRRAAAASGRRAADRRRAPRPGRRQTATPRSPGTSPRVRRSCAAPTAGRCCATPPGWPTA